MKSKQEIIQQCITEGSEMFCEIKTFDALISKAMELYAAELRKEIIEDLEKMSNQYEVVGGCYVIQKLTLDHYIETSLNNQ